MTKASQNALLQQLKQEDDPAAKTAIALELLQASLKREMVDAAMAALAKGDLDDSARPVLRDRAMYYFENPEKDKGGLLREKFARLLLQIGHPQDADIFLRGIATYERQSGHDVTQTLRAASLVGLAAIDNRLGRIYAVRLLGEPETSPFSGQPSLTAINVLANLDERLPIYQFILVAGRATSGQFQPDAVSQAFESLGSDFPAQAFRDAALPFIERDVSVVVAGIINAIVEQRQQALYDLLERVVNETDYDDLHRYAVLALAASRDETLTQMLYHLTEFCPERYLPNFIEAVELTTGTERDSLLESLQRRM